MRKNLPVFLMLLVICGLGARFFHSQSQQKAFTALQLDLTDALEQLWETRGHRVEVTPAGISARVAFPPKTSAARQQWTFALLRFVAHRHPEVTPARIWVSEIRERETYLGAPQNNEAHAEIVRREAQHWLDGMVGPDNGLVLAECLSHQVRYRTWEQRSLRGFRDQLAFVGLPMVERSRTETTVTMVIVLNGRATGVRANLARLREELTLPTITPRRIILLP